MKLYIITILVILNQCVSSQEIQGYDTSNVKYEWDIYYTEEKDSLQSLDVYWNSKLKNDKVLLFVHGGGWLSGDKKQYREMAAHLAEKGITVVLTNYRLSPKVKYPVHTEDAAAAINWTFNFINNYNGDNKNIYLMGHSAGGHIASLVVCDEKFLTKYNLNLGNIAGAITISGVFEIKPQEGGATEKYLGMVFGNDETIWKKASCKTYINEAAKDKLPGFLISWSNEEEGLIINESKNIIEEFKGAGIKFQSYIFEGKNHYNFINELKNKESGFFEKVMQFMGP
jgi:dienelactone hydrolase